MLRFVRSVPLLVVVAVLAFAVGSAGTAVAGSALTANQVKKIAAKVVNKAAPNLTVKKAATATSATTATNATKLGGQSPAAYETTSYRYRLPVQAAAAERIYSFPGLPAGTYLFTYNVILGGTIASTFCEMRRDAMSVSTEGFSRPNPVGFGALHASGIIDFTSNTVNLRCNGGNFVVYSGPDTLTSVTFTRIDNLTEVNATTP